MALELLRVDPADESGTTYYGYATPGTQDNEAKWAIKQKVIDGDVLKYLYPYITGTTTQNAYPAIQVNLEYYLQASGLIWDQRSGYTYR